MSALLMCVCLSARGVRGSRAAFGVITARHATSGACGSGCCCSAPPPRPPLRVPTSRARCARAATPAPRECRCLLLLLHAPCVTPREAAPTTQPAAGCPAAARHAALLALRAATRGDLDVYRVRQFFSVATDTTQAWDFFMVKCTIKFN